MLNSQLSVAALFTFLSLGSISPAIANGRPTQLEAPAGTYILEKTHASLTWRISHFGMSQYTARFKTFDVKLQYDPADATKNAVEAAIDLGSVETDFVPQEGRDFNSELKGDKFFNVTAGPQAKFVSKRVRGTSPRKLRVEGDLTLLGVTKPVVLDVTINGAMKQHPFAKVPWLGFSATGKVKRSAFGLNPMPQMTGVGDEVEILIQAEFIQQQ